MIAGVTVQKSVELIGTGDTIDDAVTEALDRARLTLELRLWFTLLERMHG